MSNPKVTAIIPNYNHSLYLRRRIESVLFQTYENVEVIILDDCSTDNSREIIESYRAHPSVSKIIYNEKNSGSTFVQWEKGAELATGDWIWFAESDDYSDLNFIEILMQEAIKDPDLGLIYCDSKIVTEAGIHEETFADIKNKNNNTTRWSENYKNNGRDEIEFFLLGGGTINNSSAVLFNRKLFLEVNPFDIPFRFIGDKYAFLKVLSQRDIVYRKESLNYYRNPFNSKNKKFFYSYEQFLVFSWTRKNIAFKEKKNFYNAFYELTALSFFRDWSVEKISLCFSLLKTDPQLFFLNIAYNMVRPLKDRCSHIFKVLKIMRTKVW
jgi:glycosyltransferase involved in cell wall biosynthesis